MPPRKRKGRAQVSSVDTLKRRLQKSAVYAHLGAITRAGNDPYRIAAFKGLRKSPYELLTQVYTGARLADMFPSEVELDPNNALSKYPWDSDLFGPVDEDGNPLYIAPPAPVGGGAPPGAPPLALGGAVAPPVADPNIAAILAEVRAVRNLHEAAAAGGGGGMGGGAAPVIDTTDIEDILREAYDRLSRQFGNLGDEVNRGNGAVITVLREIERTLGRIPAAEGDEEDKDDTTEREHKAGEDTGGDVFRTPAGDRTGRTSRTETPRTPIDSVRASLTAGTPIAPARTAEAAFDLAQRQVVNVINHFGGGEESAQTAETIRKTLLRQTIRLREISTPHITGRNAERLSKIPELKANDLSVSNLNVMLRLIRFFSGTGMPAEFGRISSPAVVGIAQPAIPLLAILLEERGEIEHRVPELPAPAPAPDMPTSAA
jgi:hypothetical protein